MKPEELFEAWTPPESAWCAWAKPVLFTSVGSVDVSADAAPRPEANVAWASPADGHTAIVVDVPGTEAFDVGLALARLGYRPVPLFNGAHGSSPAVDVAPLVRRLVTDLPDLVACGIRDDAPPAFLLDARRGEGSPGPGTFDNRWIVLPQDLPSATFLAAHGVRRVVLVQRSSPSPRPDLAHVLLRWQEGGIEVLASDVAARPGPPTRIVVERPSHFRTVLHLLLVMVGLRRGSAGGFGARIPFPVEAGPGAGRIGGFYG